MQRSQDYKSRVKTSKETQHTTVGVPFLLSEVDISLSKTKVNKAVEFDGVPTYIPNSSNTLIPDPARG